MVQISFRANTEFRNRLKIMAIKKGITMNDLLKKYVEEALEKDEKKK